MAVELFSPIINPAKMHQHFKHVAFSPELEAERQIIKSWATGFVDRDGKFIKEFQSTFNSGFWEIYLNAVFRFVGCEMDYSHFAPDYMLAFGDYKFAAEAGIASNAEGYAPEWEALSTLDDNRDVDPSGFLELATIRLLNTIVSKHKKYVESYNKLDWVIDKPFVLCIAPFEQPFAFDQNDHAIRRVLYGFDVPITTDIDGRRVALGEAQTETATKDNGKTLALGLFTRPDFKEISAVIFSNTATFGKVRAIAGVGSGTDKLIFRATRFAQNDLNHEVRVVERPYYVESILDGLHVCLNPYAEHPFDPSMFAPHEVCIHTYDPRTNSYMPDAPDGFLIHRVLFGVKTVSHLEKPAKSTPKVYKKHRVRAWQEGELVRVGGWLGPFNENYMSHYRGWTVVIAHDTEDDDWGGQGIESLCQDLPNFIARNKAGGLRSFISGFEPTQDEAFAAAKRQVDQEMGQAG